MSPYEVTIEIMTLTKLPVGSEFLTKKKVKGAGGALAMHREGTFWRNKKTGQ